MFLALIIITAVIVIWFVIGYNRGVAERNRINHISKERQQGENARLEEKRRIKAEERASEDQEERKLRIELEANVNKVREGRDLREKELRQKIEDRKKREAEDKKIV
ncbi:MAG: hypothetical protein WC723_05170 [Candidatus Omnitrophota bacterium]